jgi:hypothetical protein
MDPQDPVTLHIDLPATDRHKALKIGITVRDGHVVESWMPFLLGWPIDRVDRWVRQRGGMLE